MADPRAPVYAPLLRGLHWLMFVILAVSAAGGVWTHYLPQDGALRGQVLLAHKSLGVVLFGLVILRVLFRLLLGTPPYRPALGKFNEKLAGAAHLLLYAVMFALPITGYVMSMAGQHEFALFGYYPVPNYIPANKNLAEAAQGGHMLLAYLLGALVVLHLLAALWHKMRGDNVYERMWPA
jgi:cytochrome b561